MVSDGIAASWIAAVAVFAVVLIVLIQAPRELREYSTFSQSKDTKERISFFYKWLRESFLLYTLVSLAVLFVIGRLDALSGFPPEFAALREAVMTMGSTADPDAQDLSFSYVLGILVGAGLAIFAGLMVKKAAGTIGSKLRLSAPDIEPLIPRNSKERFPVMALVANASVGEELFFRLLLPLALVMIGVPPLWAFAFSIVVFGLVHLYQGWIGVALTALAGLVLTYTYLRAGSIWTPVAVHFLINTIALLIRPPLIRMLGGKSEGAN